MKQATLPPGAYSLNCTRISKRYSIRLKDKITVSRQSDIIQICGKPTRVPVQLIKTDAKPVFNFGQSSTLPLTQNFPGRDVESNTSYFNEY